MKFLLLDQLDDLAHLLGDITIALPFVGAQAAGAVLDTGFGIGEIAAAIIEIKPGYTLSEDEINDFCLELPRYKRPRRIIFAEVPRNPTGKIEKPKLRSIYCGESLVAQQIEG